MDTSNSTCSPIDLLLGKRIPQKQITQSDWVRILNAAFDEMKPRLKYMPKMVTPDRLLNRSEELHGDLGKTEFSSERGPEEMCPELMKDGKGMILCGLPPIAFGLEAPQGHPKKNPYDCFLVQTMKGRLFAWFSNYFPGEWPDDQEPKTVLYRIRSLTLKEVSFDSIALTESSRIKNFDPCVGAKIIDSLYYCLKEVIDDKHKRLAEMEAIAQEMRRQMESIDIFIGHFDGKFAHPFGRLSKSY